MSPCSLPTAALVAGYVSGESTCSRKQSFLLSLAFVLGISFTLSLLGIFAGVATSFVKNLSILNYLIAIILITMGLWMWKIFEINGNWLPSYQPKKGSGIIGAFLLGIPFGIAASPCTMPITVSVLAYSASKGSSFYGMLLMFTYALGRSIPLLLVGTFVGLLKCIKRISAYQGLMEKVGGSILILLGFYFIWIG